MAVFSGGNVSVGLFLIRCGLGTIEVTGQATLDDRAAFSRSSWINVW
jgi:hypothetical protein